MGKDSKHRHSHHDHHNKVLGATLFGLIVGAIGGLLLSPKSGSENRENLADWMDDFKHDVNRKVQETKGLTEEKYGDIVEAASDKYRKLKNIKENELDDFVDELKERWDRIKDQWDD